MKSLQKVRDALGQHAAKHADKERLAAAIQRSGIEGEDLGKLAHKYGLEIDTVQRI